MSLRLPSEIVVERFLPAARALLAAEFEARGLTQEEIAAHLGVSQAAVSKYASGEVQGDPRIREDPRTAATMERIAAGLVDGGMDEFEALGELLELVRALEDRGPICTLHEEAVPALRGLGCDLCVRGPSEDRTVERGALDDVRRAARVLATAPGMADFVPNVGTNVGAALPNAADAADVAAIPGRIYAVGGRVEVPADPEFGASRHVATALLAARTADPTVGGAINVATDDRLLEAAAARGIEPLEFDASYDGRGRRLRDRFSGRGGVPAVCHHRGAFGVEPITYVFGGTAVEAAELVAGLVATAGEGG